MTAPLSDLAALLRSMDPALHEGIYVYTSIPGGQIPDGLSVIAFVREPEGLSIVIPESEALEARLPILFRCAWITLTVNSDLQAVGLTAAFAAALGNAAISCNVVAGAYHDHLFVPIESAEQAMIELRQLQQSSRADFQRREG
jgi:uncharacterized protein